MTKEIKKNEELQNENKELQKVKSLNLRILEDKKLRPLQYGICALLLSFCVVPEVFAVVNLEQQLDKISVLTSGKIKTVGISFATIACAIYAIIKSSPLLAVTIVGIGAGLAYYLEWIAGGMTLSTLVDNLHLFA